MFYFEKKLFTAKLNIVNCTLQGRVNMDKQINFSSKNKFLEFFDSPRPVVIYKNRDPTCPAGQLDPWTSLTPVNLHSG